jgi:hypothetical protein
MHKKTRSRLLNFALLCGCLVILLSWLTAGAFVWGLFGELRHTRPIMQLTVDGTRQVYQIPSSFRLAENCLVGVRDASFWYKFEAPDDQATQDYLSTMNQRFSPLTKPYDWSLEEPPPWWSPAIAPDAVYLRPSDLEVLIICPKQRTILIFRGSK